MQSSNFHGTVDFSNSNIKQGYQEYYVNHYKPLNLYEVNVGTSLTFNKTKFFDSASNLELSSAIIGNSLNFDKISFAGGLIAEGLKVGFDIYMDSTNFLNKDSKVSFNSTSIAENGLFFDSVRINGDLNMGYLKANKYIELHHCLINRADFHDMTAGSKLKFDTAFFKDFLNLTNVTTSVLEMNSTSYPSIKYTDKPPKKGKDYGVKLDGLYYKNLIVGKEGCEDSLRVFFNLLQMTSFSRSGYRLFAEYLSEHDFNAFSDEVYILMKKKEGGILILLQRIFIGNGRHPYYAFIWSLGFILFGTCIFQKRWMMSLVEHNKIPFNSWWYSLGLFIPLIYTETPKYWTPNKAHKFLRFYFRLHAIFGFVLIPFGIAGLTGILK